MVMSLSRQACAGFLFLLKGSISDEEKGQEMGELDEMKEMDDQNTSHDRPITKAWNLLMPNFEVSLFTIIS